MSQVSIFDFIINITVGNHVLEATYDVEEPKVDGIFCERSR